MPSSPAVNWAAIGLALSALASVNACTPEPQPASGGGRSGGDGGTSAAASGGASGTGATGGSGGRSGGESSGGNNGNNGSSTDAATTKPDVTTNETTQAIDTSSSNGKPDTAPDQTASADTAPPPTGQKILLHTLRTGYRHESAVPASMILRDKLTALGFMVQIGEDGGIFTDAGLAPFKVVVMVQASGAPFGNNAGGIEALTKFVRAGGGLVGFHGASDLGYPADSPYVALIGGKFIGHPGGIRNTACEAGGMMHPSITRLTKFMIRDEIYTFSGQNPANQVVVTCAADSGSGKVPSSWFRAEGQGRVFYTGFGHPNELWTTNSMLVNDHVVPAILWAAGR